MTEPSRKKGTRGRALPVAQAQPAAGSVLEDHGLLCFAVEGFVRDNSNFESSVAINAALDDARRAPDLQALFEVPLQHKLFSLEGALRWVLFLALAPGRAVLEGDDPFSEGAEFSPKAALEIASQVYDVGVQEAVWDHFEPDEEDEDADEDEEGA